MHRVDPPPPVFSTLPEVIAIEPTGQPRSYEVTLREPGGEPKTARFEVFPEGPRGAAPDWDIFWRWPGDAESLRAVIRRVCEFHDARQE